MRSCTGSQCSSLRVGVMWSRSLFFATTLVAAFDMDCVHATSWYVFVAVQPQYCCSATSRSVFVAVEPQYCCNATSRSVVVAVQPQYCCNATSRSVVVAVQPQYCCNATSRSVDNHNTVAMQPLDLWLWQYSHNTVAIALPGYKLRLAVSGYLSNPAEQHLLL